MLLPGSGKKSYLVSPLKPVGGTILSTVGVFGHFIPNGCLLMKASLSLQGILLANVRVHSLSTLGGRDGVRAMRTGHNKSF
jgi:hypothetical protein